MIVIVENGTLRKLPDDTPLSYDLLKTLVGSDRFDVPPLPVHPFPESETIAYAPADARGHAPNVRIEATGAEIHGAIVILGMEGDGHRHLTASEAAAYEVGPATGDGLPVLVVRMPPTAPS